jgi:hypothetical protein
MIGTQQVSRVAIGGASWSLSRHQDAGSAIATIHAAIDAGITTIGTARAYTTPDQPAQNEWVIARALSARPDGDSVFIATKGGHFRRGTDEFPIDASPAALRRDCELSLRALGIHPQTCPCRWMSDRLSRRHRPLRPRVNVAKQQLAKLLYAGPYISGGAHERDRRQRLAGLIADGRRDRESRACFADVRRDTRALDLLVLREEFVNQVCLLRIATAQIPLALGHRPRGEKRLPARRGQESAADVRPCREPSYVIGPRLRDVNEVIASLHAEEHRNARLLVQRGQVRLRD